MKQNITIRKTLSIKKQIVATIIAIASAVLIPQFFHLLGRASGLGTSLGEIILPMHLSILVVGLIAGPYAGAITGLVSPVISFALTGMPTIVMLPFMVVELFGYGLSAGLLKNVKCATTIKVIIAQVAGRVIRAIAILLAFYAFGYAKVGVATIWLSIPKGLLGILLQLVLIPLFVYRVKEFTKNDD